jgi:Xaa-Pro aminopeptidase
MMNIEECARRRCELATELLPGSVAIVWSAAICVRNGDGEYPYRQDSNFYYLTHYNFANSVCIITKSLSNTVSTTLIIPARDLAQEIWDGARYSIAEAEKYYGVEQAIYATSAEQFLAQAVADAAHIYFDYSHDALKQGYIFALINKAQQLVKRYYLHPSMHDLGGLLKRLRMYKSAHEIHLIRQACKISSQAHSYVMTMGRPGMSERDLELAFRSSCLQQGLIEMAYSPIVAGGKNACTLHYHANNQVLNAGELVLIDAGAEYQAYASDITRTWPINGKFSASQKIIYEIVLQAQLAGIKEIIPGNTWEQVQQTVIQVLTLGLVEYKLLTGSVEQNIATQQYSQYYMHGFGHWLGLDTHDQGLYKIRENGEFKWQKFAPGMVLTMEPGLYIASTHSNIDAAWHNIGIRIEDDIVVTSTSNEVLSDAPKLIADIEYLYAQAL